MASALRTHLPRSLAWRLPWILDEAGRPLSVALLARGMAVSPRTLRRHFSRDRLGSPVSFVRWMRLAVAISLIRRGRTVEATSLALRFSSAGSLRQLSRDLSGRGPKALAMLPPDDFTARALDGLYGAVSRTPRPKSMRHWPESAGDSTAHSATMVHAMGITLPA